ncbi:hypothetical protein BH09MYX1_BH09MYX1_02690 [soil metagenome]
MSAEEKDPFTREVVVDEPAFVGARWWQDSIRSTVDRRAVLKGILIAGAAVAGLALVFKIGKVLTASARPTYDDDDFYGDRQRSLEMQKRFGWSFGATEVALVFDGATQVAFDRTAIDRLADDLVPTQARLAPFYVRTLFEAPAALPNGTTTDGSAPPKALRDALVPIHDAAMTAAYRAGRALAEILASVPVGTAIVVDLGGADSVAFAAGAAERFEPIFLFDNWPHPYGVVPSHRALAAALYYQPRFLRAKKARKADAPALFVLDRTRLAPYTDSPTEFDNRWTAKLPPANKLTELGVSKLMYVVPYTTDLPELDDVNDDFYSYETSFVAVRYVASQNFDSAMIDQAPMPTPTPTSKDAGLDSEAMPAVVPPDDPKLDRTEPDDAASARYLASSIGGAFFAAHYDLPSPWPKPPPEPRIAPPSIASYRFVNRVQAYIHGQKPNDFGTVPVVIAVATGIIVASAMGRSGSWNRSPYYSSGGGG